MQWLEGNPQKLGFDAQNRPCFLLEFPDGDRFVAVRLTNEGMINLDDGGIVTDEPKRYHVIRDPGNDPRMH